MWGHVADATDRRRGIRDAQQSLSESADVEIELSLEKCGLKDKLSPLKEKIQ